MSIYTAFNGLCEKFILNDVNSQVISMLRQCIGENGDGKFGKDLHSQKIVATVMCTEKRTIPRIPPFSNEKETTFTYDGVEITTNSEEIYAECEKGMSYQAIIKIATHKKNGKKLYFLENVADKPVSKAVKE